MRPIRRIVRATAIAARPKRKMHRGQSLIEFALILPILLMLIGGIVQYGMIFATKHSLIQVARDVGRWAATQGEDAAGNPLMFCHELATDTTPQPLTKADEIALESRLMGYTTGAWNSGNFVWYADNTVLPPIPPNDPLPANPPHDEGVEVVWSHGPTDPCPTVDNTTVAWVTIRLTHRAPVILPGFPWLPGLGDFFVVSTTATFRMEPLAAP